MLHPPACQSSPAGDVNLAAAADGTGKALPLAVRMLPVKLPTLPRTSCVFIVRKVAVSMVGFESELGVTTVQ